MLVLHCGRRQDASGTSRWQQGILLAFFGDDPNAVLAFPYLKRKRAEVVSSP